MLTRFVAETDVDVPLLAGRYTLLDRRAVRDSGGDRISRPSIPAELWFALAGMV